jgi:transposase-like protein
MSYKIFDGKVVCPRCDGNGLVYKARISDLNKAVYICNECEAMWQEGEMISNHKFQDLSTYIEKNNLDYDSTKIEDINYDWYK